MLLIAPEIDKYTTTCFQIQLRTQTIQCLFFTLQVSFPWCPGRCQSYQIYSRTSILNLEKPSEQLEVVADLSSIII